MDKLKETIILSDGRKVIVQETTGLDEMIAGKICGMENGLMSNMNVLMILSLVSIDGKPVKRPHDMAGVQVLAAQFKTKDFGKIRQIYQRMNVDKEDKSTGESEATD